MLERYIEIIRPRIVELFKDDASGHDISHLTRVMNLAVRLCEREKGDVLIVGIAAFMHDIHRIMQNKKGEFVSPRDSLPVVREIFTSLPKRHKNIMNNLFSRVLILRIMISSLKQRRPVPVV